MAKINIIIPEATRNLITNPSVEKDTTGWTAQNAATISRVVTRARFGVASLQVVTPGAVAFEGAFFRIKPDTSATNYVGSVYIRGTGRVRLRMRDGFNGNQRVSETIALNDDRWIRHDLLGSTGNTSSDDLRLYVETVDAQAVTFYLDGAQIEKKEVVTSYADGDQDGCRWDIIANASESVRDGEIRTAGVRRQLAGTCRDEDDLYVTTFSGFGFAPIRQQVQEFAIAAGAFFQRTKVLSRVLQMVFWAKDELAQGKNGIALTRLHELRQTLIDFVKPDLVKGAQHFTLEYEENDVTLQLKALYEAGLELDHDIRNKWADSFPLRLLAVEPYWVEDDQEVAVLDLQDTINPLNRAGSRFDGVWNNMNYGVDGQIEDIAEDEDGRIYFVGDFTTVNNNAAAIDPNLTANRVCYWDGTQFRAMGAGFDAILVVVSVAPDGTIWVGGNFTQLVGGAAAGYNRIAYWDWDTETWNNLPIGANNGLNAFVYSISFLDNGDAIIGGQFTADGAGNTYNRIVRWDGTQFHAIGGSNGVNGIVYSAIPDMEGQYVYLGGTFTTETGGAANTFNRAGRFDTTNFLFETMGGLDIPAAAPIAGSAEAQQMLNGTATKMTMDNGGNIYCGGSFDDVYLGTSNDKEFVVWNGSSWNGLSDTTDVFPVFSQVLDITIDKNGLIYWAGRIGENPNEEGKLVIWNGSVWTDSDIELSNVYHAAAVHVDAQDNVYIGTRDAGTALASGITTINNIGTAAVNPVVRIEGPCTVRWLENQTADKRLFLNAELQENEQLTIDFENKEITTTFKGKAFTVLRSNSDFGSWNLLPGNNTIALFVTDDVDAEALIRYTPRHWSADAVSG